MNDLSFEIKTAKDFLEKLKEDYAEYCKNGTSSRIALNCAMTAWHLTDWFYNEYYSVLSVEFSKLPIYQEEMKRKCPPLQIMHDITNGTKHYLLKRHTPEIKSTKLHKGSFDHSFDRSFDISTLDIEMNNGKKVYFEDVIKTVVDFWEDYFQNNFE